MNDEERWEALVDDAANEILRLWGHPQGGTTEQRMAHETAEAILKSLAKENERLRLALQTIAFGVDVKTGDALSVGLMSDIASAALIAQGLQESS